MAIKRRRLFDPKTFLAKVGEGRSIGKYGKEQIVFSQGDAADAVFYIQKGKVKLTVVSEQGKEAVVAILGTNEFFGEGHCEIGADDKVGDLTHDLWYHRVDFAWHDRGARLNRGQADFAQARARAGGEQAKVIANLRKLDGERRDRRHH
jgi:Cyclic nucleotide-binding domain